MPATCPFSAPDTEPARIPRSSLTLGRREFIAGSAVSVAAPLLPALASRAGTDLTYDGVRFIARLGRRAVWVVDPALYAGRPALTFHRSSSQASLSLTGARYPGTPFVADLQAEFRRERSGWMLRITTALARFDAWVSLDLWLMGMAPLENRVVLPVREVAGGAFTWRIGEQNRARAACRPCWCGRRAHHALQVFAVGRTQADFHRGSEHAPVDRKTDAINISDALH